MKTKKAPQNYNTNTATLGGRIAKSMIGAEKTPEIIALKLNVDVETVLDWLADKEPPNENQMGLLEVLFEIKYGDDWLRTGKHTFI